SLALLVAPFFSQAGIRGTALTPASGPVAVLGDPLRTDRGLALSVPHAPNWQVAPNGWATTSLGNFDDWGTAESLLGRQPIGPDRFAWQSAGLSPRPDLWVDPLDQDAHSRSVQNKTEMLGVSLTSQMAYQDNDGIPDIPRPESNWHTDEAVQ